MKKISFNDFKKLGIELEIGERMYNIEGIPYPIEEDIFSNFTALNEIFSDISKINDEWKDRFIYWIWETISFEKNNNKDLDKKVLFDNLSLTYRIGIMTLLISLISERMVEMQSQFGAQKKTVK